MGEHKTETSRIKIIWEPSPNFKIGNKNRDVTCIVLHATATTGIDSPLEWLTSSLSKVSAHYLIGKDGKKYQLVKEKDIAYHAGNSEWRGKKWVNNFSIGIELVNANDGIDPWPTDQIESCAILCLELCNDYSIALVDVVGHRDIAPGRKTDPAGFNFDEFRMRLIDLGVKSK